MALPSQAKLKETKMTANFSKCKNPAKIENPNPTGNSVHGKMKSVNCSKTGKMGLDKTGSSSLKGVKSGS